MLSILTTLTLAVAPQAVDPIGSLQRLDVPSDPQGVIAIDLVLDGQPAELVLERHSLRAGDFQLFVTRPDGVPVPMPAPQINTWRGTVTGWPDTVVSATINHEGLSAIVADYATDREWQVQPADGYPLGTYSVARAFEVPVTPGVCGTPDGVSATSVNSGGTILGSGTGLQLTEVAFDADFEFYQRNGNSVQATIDDIERVMNRVDVIYVRDCDVTFQLTAVVIRSSSADPYTSSVAGTLLTQFRAEWNTNFVGVRKDIAHLFTGRNVNGGTIGVAYLGVVCNQQNNYGLSESRFTNNLTSRTGLTAHEMGHNFNAEHCDGLGDCRIMCSGLGGCTGDITRFGALRGGQITNYAASRGCLLDLAPPLALPVFDSFPTTQLNRDIWISQQGVDITTAAVSEPSAPNSARLAATNAGIFKDDTLISNKILLGSITQGTVSFYSQHRGVPNGGAIEVEIYDSSDDWVLLTRLVSNGTNQNSFQFNQIPIPAGAFHDEAQIRIRADVSSSAQQWFIDDFRVDDVSCGQASSYCVAAPNSVSINGATLGLSGSTNHSANDLVLVATSCPLQSFGIYLMASDQIQTPLGNGFLCVNGSQIFRLAVVQADVFGTSIFGLDLNNLPGGAAINPGDTVNFQLWYRDSVGAGFNLTNGLEVNFCP